MVRLLVVFLIILFCQTLPVSGQTPYADSLLRVLERTRQFTERVDLLNEIASAYYDYDVANGYDYASRAYDLARANQYLRGMRQSLTLKGYYYYERGEYPKALNLYRRSAELDMPEDDLLGYNYVLAGNAYRALAQYDSSYFAYNKALDVLKKTDAEVQVAFAYKNLGRLFVIQWKNEEAEEYFRKAAEIYERLGRRKALADTWYALAGASKNQANYQEANQYVEKACRVATTMHDDFLRLYCLINQGDMHFRRGENVQALETLFQALEMMKHSELPRTFAEVYFNVGEVYEALGQNDMALKYFFESLGYSERLGIKHEVARVLNSIGWIYKNQHNFPLSHRYINRSLALRQEINDEHGVSNCYNVRGLVYLQAGKYDSAVLWLEKSLEIRKRIGHREGISACMFNLALIYEERKDYAKALEYQTEALAMDEAIGNRYSIGISYNSIGHLYTRLKNFGEARKYLQKAKVLADETQSKTLQMNNSNFWALLYEAEGDPANALKYHKRYAQLNDSIYYDNSASKLAELEALYQVEQKDQEIKLLNQEKLLHENEIQLQRSKINFQNIILISAIAGFILVSLLAFKTHQYNKQISKAHREIIEQKEEIQAQSEELIEANQTIARINKKLEGDVEDRTSALRQAYKELDTFFYRSSHDFRRPLTTFLGLAEVAKITVKDPNALELFAKVKETAHNLDKMLVKLQSISDMGAQQLVYKEVFVKEIFESVEDNFQEEIKDKGIHVSIDVDLRYSFFCYPAMVRIIIENLLENSISFSGPINPFVRLKAFQMDGQTILEVEDNGEGIDSEYHDRVFDMYFRGNEKSKGNGLGLYIVKKAVEKLNGVITFESEYSLGSTFRIILPSGNPN